MFAVLHSDINSLKSGLLHLTDRAYCKKSRSAKVKDGIINFILRNYLVDRYKWNNRYLCNTEMSLERAALKRLYEQFIKKQK